MKKRILWSVVVLLLFLTTGLLWRREPEQAGSVAEKSSPELVRSQSQADKSQPADIGEAVDHELPERAQPSAEKKRAFQAIFSASLSLYGKVVDQDGQPVPNARVEIGVADKPWDSGSSYQRTTGPDGLFEITGVAGGGIYAEVQKEGYYAGKESRRLFQSGEMPTREAPAIWKLYRKGPLETLSHHDQKMIDMPMDGTPVEYDFNTGTFVGAGQGQLRVEVKVEGSMQKRFSWWYRLSIPSGGLVRRTNEFDFFAPVEGYTEALERRIDAADPSWSGAFNGDYFIKLPDGTFGRVEFSLHRGRGSFSFRVYHAAINPSGGRNLEYDPKLSTPFVRSPQAP